MGQARLRGSRDDRIHQARSKIVELRPEKIVCNNCQTEFSEFEAMDAKGLKGVTAVFAGLCPSCKHSTFVYRGDLDAITELALAQQEYMGEAQIGVQKA